MGILFYLSIMIFAGLIFSFFAKKLKLPNVTGYLLSGLFVGPFILNLIPHEVVKDLNLISEMALGFIAFTIGTEFKISYFKEIGLTPVVIAVFEALMAVVLVFIALILLTDSSIEFALVLASIAAATAPAATIMVIRQYKASGPVTETLLSVVALDDAVCLIAFGFATTIAKMVISPTSSFDILSLLTPFMEIIFSISGGILLGLLFSFILNKSKQSNKLSLTVGFLFLAVSLSKYLHLSDLLMCMAMGAAIINTCSISNSILKSCESITPPLYMLFFIVSGAELNLTVIPTVGFVGIIYVCFRVIGKLLGAFLGAKIMKSPQQVQRYLGLTLIPQAGVAIGLSLAAESIVPNFAQEIRAIVLCATFIYEIVGPVISKISLEKAGEISIGNELCESNI